MDRDARFSTRAYYNARLCPLLGIEPQSGWPPVHGFDALVDLFDDLAAWLAEDEGGQRGLLALPDEIPAQRVVGVPVSQTLLRGRDRALLGSFFDERRSALDAGHDPLRLLRSWAGRGRLTGPANAQLDKPDFAASLRGAIAAAFAAWDGSLVDEDGSRALPCRLRLGVGAGRVTLNLTVPALAASVSAQSPGGPVDLRPGAETTLDLRLLDHASRGPVYLGLPDRTRVRALPGPTMMFDVGDAGMELTAAPTGDGSVWLLTCDRSLAANDWGVERLVAADLPAGWRLIADVDPDALPNRPTVAPPPGVAGAWLQGGLALNDGAFLAGHPPAVDGDWEEPVTITLTGPESRDRQIGYLEPGEPRTLHETGGVGSWAIIVGDEYELTFESVARGLREGVGALRHAPSHPALRLAGACAVDPAFGDAGPTICGAVIEGDRPEPWRPPLTVRANATVRVIYRDGTVRACAPHQQPAWSRQIGLPAGEPWEIPDGADAVWLCVDSRSHPRVVAVADAQVVDTDEALDVADRFADALVIDRDGLGAAVRWAKLVKLARDTEEAPVE